jgi:hypothetical protein
MQNMTTVEAKAFVPSKDFGLSKRFYQDLGFDLGWSSEDLAYFSHGNSSFLLQNFYEKAHAENFKMHLLVEDVEAWWNHVQEQGLEASYGVRVDPPSDKPWGIRDFAILDPTGVAWRIGQNIDEANKKITNEHGMPKTRQGIVYETAKILGYVVVATMVARNSLTLPENVIHGLRIVETFALIGVALMSMLLAVRYIRALFARATRLPSSDQGPE